MSLISKIQQHKTEKMSNISFQLMNFMFKLIDFLYPHIDKRIKSFDIEEGMTVVDYGCGPGRYTTRLAKLVGEKGKVYAVDIHELAMEAVQKEITKHNLRNVETKLAQGYNSGLPNDIADRICAIDMFFIIKNPTEFLTELKQILKDDGVLIIDDGHQSRKETKSKILNSNLWKIIEESKDHLKCVPVE